MLKIRVFLLYTVVISDLLDIQSDPPYDLYPWALVL